MLPWGRYWRLGLTVTLAAAFVEGAGGTVSAITAASHSSSVQNHGIRATGTVILVDNSPTGHNVPPTADMTVALQSPASLQSVATTVHVPNQVHYQFGQTVTVLVDPHDHGYAELPGDPNATLGAIAVPVLAIIISLIAGAFLLRSVLRRWRLERAWEEAANARERDFSPFSTSMPPPSGWNDLL